MPVATGTKWTPTGQAVLMHVMDLGGGWRWTNRAYATRFQRNWYKADRAAGTSGNWVSARSWAP